MKPVSFARHRFPPDVIRQVLYFRFSLSFRDVEDLMAQRGVDVSYETIRSWTQKFGRLFAQNLRKLRAAPSARWHLDEMIAGERMFLWRAVDDEGVVLDAGSEAAKQGRSIQTSPKNCLRTRVSVRR
jgi:transposase-like protein